MPKTRTEELTDAFLKAKSDLFAHIDSHPGNLFDYRDTVWNGEEDNPQWGWNEGDWIHSVEFANSAVEKDGMIFVYTTDHAGIEAWLVFSKDKAKTNDE